MYSHILISTDGSDVARHGVEHGLSLAKILGAKVTVVTVTERFPFTAGVAGAGWVPSASEIAAFQEGQKAAADKVLADVRQTAAAMGIEIDAIHVPDAWPAEAIVDTAKSRNCNLIVMASHGRRGIGRLLLGSQTSEVLAHSTVPVLVVR